MSARRVYAQTAWELRAVLSNGEQLLLTFVIPVILLIGLGATEVVDLGTGDRLSLVVAGVITVAVMSTAFTSLAIGTAFDRRSEALALLGTTPLTRAEWGLARVLAVLAVELLQLAVIFAVAALLGWQAAGLLSILALVLIGTAAFGSLGLLLGGTVRAEAVLALANGIYLLLLFGGGTVIAADRLPAGLGALVTGLPSGALGDGLRAAASGGAVSATTWLVLAVWAVVGAGLSMRLFRWR